MTNVPTICCTSLAGLMLLLSPVVARGAGEPVQLPAAETAAAREGEPLKDAKEKSSYAVGMNLGRAIRKDADLDVDLIVQGLRDAFTGGKMRLTDTEMRAILNGLATQLKTRQAAQLGEKGAAFLADNKAKEGVVSLDSGLQYKVLKAGTGRRPTVDDTVVCHYRGTLIDGTEFDSSYKRNKPGTFPLKRVIKGWTEALQLMPVGSKWQLFIPSALAYGQRGSGAHVPPNATLIFEVELISVEAAASATSGESGPGSADPEEPRRTPAPSSPAPPAGIDISFKRDPRISKGLYTGDRWLGLPFLQVGEGNQVIVEARAEGVAGRGTPVHIAPTWIPADPDMVMVTPGQGSVVRIIVLRPGESRLEVSSEGVSRQLNVKAGYQGDTLQVEISGK